MTVTASRLMGPYHPVRDFHAGEDTLVLGEVGIAKDLQATLIQSNLERTEPTVFSLGNIQWKPRPFSKWEIYKIVKTDRIIIARIVATLIICALGIFFWKCSISSIKYYYKIYSDGHLVNFYYKSIFVITRPLRLSDIITWGLNLTIMNLAYAALCILPVASVVTAIQKRLSLEPKHHVAIRELQQVPSSGASLSTAVKDVFSKLPLTLAEAKQPKKLTLGKYTGDLWLMINCVLSKNLPRVGNPTHPFEERAMTFDELEKFCIDIKNVLAISDLTFLQYKDREFCKKNFLSPTSIYYTKI